MLKSTACKTLSAVIFMSLVATAYVARAVAPIDPFSAALSGAGALSDLQGGLSDGLDVFDASQDLLEEIDEPANGIDEFSQNTALFNRELTDLKSDMRELGYTEGDINDFSDRFNSSRVSLAQKMRALRRAIHSVKRVRDIFSKNSGKEAVVYQKATLATEQQALHLQIQQMQRQELKDLEEKRALINSRKQIINDINETTIELARKKERQNNSHTIETKYQPEVLQKWALSASVFTIIIGAITIMLMPFQSEGQACIKAGILGIILSYFLPAIINLYRLWIGV